MGWKAFCDRCEKEVERNFGNSAIFGLDDWRVEIMASHNNRANQVLCESCLLQIIREGVEKPRTRSQEG